MQMILHKSYGDMTDKEIVDLIIAGNEEAMLYLLYDRYENDLKFYAWRYYWKSPVCVTPEAQCR